jgi:hypothetical protein
MPVPAVRLKIRVRLSNGSRAYVDPVFSPNGKLKPLYGVINGKPENHPEGISIEAEETKMAPSAIAEMVLSFFSGLCIERNLKSARPHPPVRSKTS